MFKKFRPILLALSITGGINSAYSDSRQTVIIAEQTLSSALEYLSRQYEVPVIVSEGIAEDIRIKAASSDKGVLEALLLAFIDTDLNAIKDENGTIIIVKKKSTLKLDAKQEIKTLETITVVGSHIPGTDITGILPITTISRDDIEVYGADEGRDLLRMLPQNGDVNFNEHGTAGGVNTARGDLSSVNLRSVGTGNTLMLINGRRMVLHPGFQTENLVPAVTPNMNAIPAGGVERLEVMRDGASAIYGADAVAGVVNTVMVTDFEGFKISGRYGNSPGVDRRDDTVRINAGTDFSNGKGRISLFADYSHRHAVEASKLKQSSSSNRTPLLEGTAFEGNTSFDNRSSRGAFAYFDMAPSGRILTDTGGAITNSSGRFHLQPTSHSGCRFNLSDDLCIDDGFFSSTSDRDIYYDIDANRQLYSDRKRFNLFTNFGYDLNDSHELYGELGAYYAKTDRLSEPPRVLSTARIIIPADNYWNPFGPVRFDDGRLNPNRVSGVDVPEEGVALQLRDYRVLDAGRRRGIVENLSYRALFGAKGNWLDWGYDTAVLYSESISDDLTKNGVSSTKFQQALSLDTEDAYNPFNGGGPVNGTHSQDLTPNPASVISAIQADVEKKGKTGLALVDFRISNPSLFSYGAGDVGIAAGLEWRYESYEDDRGPTLDGSAPFIDAISGIYSQSDSLGNSPTNDTDGSRNVFSLFSEFAVPLVSPAMNIPLVRAAQLQLAARYEDLSDVGSVTTPRVALSWSINESVMLRGAWSEGFRAPNLIQVNDRGVSRINTVVDYSRCAAQLEKGLIEGDLSNCRGSATENVRTSSDLDPETSTSVNYGIVFTPSLVDNLTLTADYWKIEQEEVVGVLGGSNQTVLDLFLRQTGQNNPNIIRDVPTQEDIDLFAGTSIAPAGEIVRVLDPYQNLDKRSIRGIDFALNYDFDTNFGTFYYALNASRLISFEQLPGNEIEQVMSLGLPVLNFGELSGINGRPEWKGNTSIKWKKDNWRLGAVYEYIDGFDETSAQITSEDGTDEYWRIDSWNRTNLYGRYQFRGSWLDGAWLTLGVKNVFDKKAPLADEAYGFFGRVHSPIGRYAYFQISKKFQ